MKYFKNNDKQCRIDRDTVLNAVLTGYYGREHRSSICSPTEFWAFHSSTRKNLSPALCTFEGFLAKTKIDSAGLMPATRAKGS